MVGEVDFDGFDVNVLGMGGYGVERRCWEVIGRCWRVLEGVIGFGECLFVGGGSCVVKKRDEEMGCEVGDGGFLDFWRGS